MRITSRLVRPSFTRRSKYARVSGSWAIRTMAMRQSALLACRSPPLCRRRCPAFFPESAGTGDAPQWWANVTWQDSPVSVDGNWQERVSEDPESPRDRSLGDDTERRRAFAQEASRHGLSRPVVWLIFGAVLVIVLLFVFSF
jgi:hypothetical protein